MPQRHGHMSQYVVGRLDLAAIEPGGGCAGLPPGRRQRRTHGLARQGQPAAAGKRGLQKSAAADLQLYFCHSCFPLVDGFSSGLPITTGPGGFSVQHNADAVPWCGRPGRFCCRRLALHGPVHDAEHAGEPLLVHVFLGDAAACAGLPHRQAILAVGERQQGDDAQPGFASQQRAHQVGRLRLSQVPIQHDHLVAGRLDAGQQRLRRVFTSP